MCKDKNNLDKCIFDIIASMIGATGIAGIFYVGAVTTIQPLIYITLAFGILGLLFLTFTKVFFSSAKTSVKLSFLASGL